MWNRRTWFRRVLWSLVIVGFSLPVGASVAASHHARTGGSARFLQSIGDCPPDSALDRGDIEVGEPTPAERVASGIEQGNGCGDAWTFEAERRDTFQISARGEFDLVLEVFDPFGGSFVYRRDDGNRFDLAFSEEIAVGARVVGPYTVVVSPASPGAEGRYELLVRQIPPQEEFCGPGFAENRGSLETDELVAGQIAIDPIEGDGSCGDVWEFIGRADDELSIEATGLDDYDIVVDVHEPVRLILSIDNDLSPPPPTEQADVSFEDPGVRYLVVRPIDGSSGLYELVVRRRLESLPQLVAEPDPLELGASQGREEDIVRITNLGDGEVTITRFEIEPVEPPEPLGDFRIAAETCQGVVLNPGATCDVRVRFEARDEGETIVQLIAFGDDGTPLVAALVSGLAGPPPTDTSGTTTPGPETTTQDTTPTTEPIADTGGDERWIVPVLISALLGLAVVALLLRQASRSRGRRALRTSLRVRVGDPETELTAPELLVSIRVWIRPADGHTTIETGTAT